MGVVPKSVKKTNQDNCSGSRKEKCFEIFGETELTWFGG